MPNEKLKWEYDKENNKFNLYFMPYYEWELVATLCCYDDVWSYCLNDTESVLDYTGKSTERAMSEVLDIVENSYQDEINYYTEVLQHFKEARRNNAE